MLVKNDVFDFPQAWCCPSCANPPKMSCHSREGAVGMTESNESMQLLRLAFRWTEARKRCWRGNYSSRLWFAQPHTVFCPTGGLNWGPPWTGGFALHQPTWTPTGLENHPRVQPGELVWPAFIQWSPFVCTWHSYTTVHLFSTSHIFILTESSLERRESWQSFSDEQNMKTYVLLPMQTLAGNKIFLDLFLCPVPTRAQEKNALKIPLLKGYCIHLTEPPGFCCCALIMEMFPHVKVPVPFRRMGFMWWQQRLGSCQTTR